MAPGISETPQERINSPWTEEQVSALNNFQMHGGGHPFTSEGGGILIATSDGWVEEEGGPVVQTWAYTSMTDSDFLSQTLPEASPGN